MVYCGIKLHLILSEYMAARFFSPYSSSKKQLSKHILSELYVLTLGEQILNRNLKQQKFMINTKKKIEQISFSGNQI